MSNPDLCMEGFTVMFWLQMTSDMIAQMDAEGFKRQIIFSSGADSSASR